MALTVWPLRLGGRQDGTVDRRWASVARAQAGLGQPRAIFSRAIGPAFGDRKQGRRIQRDGQWPAKIIVEKRIVPDLYRFGADEAGRSTLVPVGVPGKSGGAM